MMVSVLTKKMIARVYKKLFLAALIFLLSIIIASCGEMFIFPESSDFTLTYSLSTPSPKKGETFEIKATFTNNSPLEYKIARSPNFIPIEFIKAGEKVAYIEPSELIFDQLKANEVRTANKFITVNASGKYEIHVSVSFSVINPKTNEEKDFYYGSDPIIIYVEE